MNNVGAGPRACPMMGNHRGVPLRIVEGVHEQCRGRGLGIKDLSYFSCIKQRYWYFSVKILYSISVSH